MAPATLLPPSLEGWPVAVGQPRPRRACWPPTDVISLLRLQAERGSGAFVPSLREYTAGYGLTARRAAAARRPRPSSSTRDPWSAGVEIASEVADLPSARDHRPGRQRGGGAHGRALPAARPGRRSTASRHDGRPRPTTPGAGRSGAARSSTPPASAGPTSVVATARSWRSARASTSRPGPPCSTPAAAWWPPGLVDLHTHLREPGPRGGRDGGDRHPGRRPRRVHRRGGHAQHRPAARLAPTSVRNVLALGRGGHGRGGGGRGHHRRTGPASGWRPWPSWPPSGCGSSPTTATACSRPA